MIREIKLAGLQEALTLVNNVFTEFVACDYSKEGQITFRTYLKTKYDEIERDLKDGLKKMWGYYSDDETLAGVIATRGVSHISLLFVATSYQRRGIARQLFEMVLAEVKKTGAYTKLSVNSSPYAVGIYQKLGLHTTGPEQENNGIRFTPMEYII